MDHELIKFSSLTSAIIIGLIIGLRHSTDGDHIIAISTLAKEYKNIFKSLWIGVSWGLGHSTPLMILGVLILISKQAMMDIYNSISVYFDLKSTQKRPKRRSGEVSERSSLQLRRDSLLLRVLSEYTPDIRVTQ